MILRFSLLATMFLAASCPNPPSPPSPPAPTPTATPSVPPVTLPFPSPSPGACPATSVDVEKWQNIIKPHSGQQFDSTPVACGSALVAKLNNCGVYCCELSQEKGNQACADALYGQTKNYDSTGAVLGRDTNFTSAPKLQFVYDDNDNIVKVVNGAGWVTVCGSKGPSTCVKAQMTATAPPCTIPPGSNQGCVSK